MEAIVQQVSGSDVLNSTDVFWPGRSLATDCGLSEIPIARVKNATPGWYVSAIAQRMAGCSSDTPQYWAEQIAQRLAQTIYCNNHLPYSPVTALFSKEKLNNLDQVLQEMWNLSSVWVVSTGWVHWQLRSQGLALWLQTAVELLPLCASQPLMSISSADVVPFNLLYVYLRCQSLLMLAEREGLLSWVMSDLSSTGKTIAEPFPWFDALPQLEPPDWQLLQQLIVILDDLPSQSACSLSHVCKLLLVLAQQFEVFYAQSAIWGTSKLHFSLAQARLGLIWVTYSLLHVVLIQPLGLHLPASL